MRVIGIEANVGSLLYPWAEAGHEVVGNYDSRPIVNDKNFGLNFPGVPLFNTIKELHEYIDDTDVIMSQPSCSKYSPLSRKAKDSYSECVNLAYWYSLIKPKFFIIESKLDYIYEMPLVDGYKYHLEWVSNYHYGNTQSGRNRLWIIGVRDDIDWKFFSNEKEHSNTVESVLDGLPNTDIPEIDHIHEYKPFLKDSQKGEYLSLEEAFKMLKRDGKLSYTAMDGQRKNRINRKLAKRTTSSTITGGGTWFHWDKMYPLTLREKARIQGFPDTFSFKGLSNTKKDKAVGKSMPFEFTRYLVSQIDGSSKITENSKVVPEPAKLTIFKLGEKLSGKILV